MSTRHFHLIPAIAIFEPSEACDSLLRRLEDFLAQHEQVSKFEFDDSVDNSDRISVMFRIQLGFSEEECDDDHPTGGSVQAWEDQLENLLNSHFNILSVELLDDATIYLDWIEE